MEDLKDRWADGAFVGKTQEETGYRVSCELAKITALQELIKEVFEPEGEIGNGE